MSKGGVPSFGELLLAPGSVGERIEAAFELCRRYLETTTRDDVLASGVAGSSSRAALAEMIGGLAHVGFLAPRHASAELMGAAATRAGFTEGHATIVSRLVAQELSELVGGRAVPTTIFVARAPFGGVEAFVPDEDDALVQSWIARGVATHVALKLRSSSVFPEATQLLVAEGFEVPRFFKQGPVSNGRMSLMYFDLPARKLRIELLHVVGA
jgi:hypothetical protein